MTDAVTIYMPLLNEGTEVWRPVSAVKRVDGTYLVLGTVPEDEEWMFGPGTVVHCQPKKFQGDFFDRLAAIAISD